MTTARLRLLHTTDLHMHLLQDEEMADRSGLINLIPLIDRARTEVSLTCLFDTGDFLQGNPVADQFAETSPRPHPAIAAFNALEYDAITPGNHDFDYGVPFLDAALSDSDCPVVCANIERSSGAPYLPPWALLRRRVTCDDDVARDLTIGVLGVTTPQLVDWNAHLLNGALASQDPLMSARQHLPDLRAAGADVIVVLCHGGISPRPEHPGMENPALPLAALPGVDAVLAGHTHASFPNAAARPGPIGADVKEGTLQGTPATLASAYGAALGQIDLTLSVTAEGWNVAGHEVRLLRPKREPLEHPLQQQLLADLSGHYHAARRRLDQPIARTTRRISSHLTLLGHDDTLPLIAAAQSIGLDEILDGSPHADLPRLFAVSPYRAGGHGGAQNYTAIPPGPITRRDAAGLAPFNDPVAAVLRRGWQVRHWLEYASRIFAVVRPGTTGAPLIDSDLASYHFDRMAGLRYRIDLSQPPQLEAAPGAPCARIRDVTFGGARLEDDALFVVATSPYRTNGGGGFPVIDTGDVIGRSRRGLTDLLVDTLASGLPEGDAAPWDFSPCPGTSVVLPLNPDARMDLSKVFPSRARIGAADESGFVPVSFDL